MKPALRFSLYNIIAFGIPLIGLFAFLIVGGLLYGQNPALLIPLAIIAGIIGTVITIVGAGLLGLINFGFYRLSVNKFENNHKLITMLFSGGLFIVLTFLPLLLGLATFGLVFLGFMLVTAVSSLIALWLAMVKTELRVE